MNIPASVNINIPQLFQDAFGIYARFPVYVLGKHKPGAKPDDMKMDEWQLGNSQPSATPATSIWSRFSFRHPDDPSGDPIFYFPPVTICEVTNQKNIVKTALIGKDNTVKELMSNGDDLITFKGLIINFDDTNAYPELAVSQMKKFVKTGLVFPVVSKLLNDVHGIYSLVIESSEWASFEGKANVQPFTITASSDIDIVLDYNQ